MEVGSSQPLRRGWHFKKVDSLNRRPACTTKRPIALGYKSPQSTDRHAYPQRLGRSREARYRVFAQDSQLIQSIRTVFAHTRVRTCLHISVRTRFRTVFAGYSHGFADRSIRASPHTVRTYSVIHKIGSFARRNSCSHEFTSSHRPQCLHEFAQECGSVHTVHTLFARLAPIHRCEYAIGSSVPP